MNLTPHGDQDPLILFQMSHLGSPWQIGCGKDADHPRKGLGLRGINGAYHCLWMLRADRASIDHTRKTNVIGLFGNTEGFGGFVDTGETFSHASCKRRRRKGENLPQEFGCQQNSLFDLLIADASTDVAAESGFDFLTGGITAVQQGLGGEDHGRSAETALNRSAMGE